MTRLQEKIQFGYPVPWPYGRKIVPDGVEERSVDVRGHRMRYLTAGSGPDLLLVHGLLGYSFQFSENIVPLAKHFRVLVPDLLNFGYSERCEIDASLGAAAESLFAFLDAVGSPAAHVIGSSYGGAAAMIMAARRPERVNGLVLVSPANPFSEIGRWQIRFFSTWLGGIIGLYIHRLPMVTTISKYRLYGDPQRAIPGTFEGYHAPIRMEGLLQHAVKMTRCWQHDFRALQADMQKLADRPMLLIWGDKDTMVDIASGYEMQKVLKRSTLKVMKTAGHIPNEELPEEFHAIVLEYLSSIAETPAGSPAMVSRR